MESSLSDCERSASSRLWLLSLDCPDLWRTFPYGLLGRVLIGNDRCADGHPSQVSKEGKFF
jgi:hypothetical protein